MYFLTMEERQYLIKGLLPKSREIPVSNELRGWNWNQPPLASSYEIKLALSEVASKFCSTGRDLYLKRVLGEKASPNILMIEGLILHDVLAKIFIKAKKLIYTLGVSQFFSIIEELSKIDYSIDEKWKKSLEKQDLAKIEKEIRIIWDFEHRSITSRLQETLAKQPYISEDSLAYLALPLVLEQRLDGSFLGLSHHLSTDAFVFMEPMILDVKFGGAKDFYRLSTTGYALVMESLYEYPVNLGCLIYPKFLEDGRLVIDKDFHIIDDELRQWFIEERDEKMRMIFDEFDPGKPDKCWEFCHYKEKCLYYGE